MTVDTPLLWVVWLIIGALIGLVLNRVLPAGYGSRLDMLAGAFGGVLGGLLFVLAGAVGATNFTLLSVFLAMAGAVMLFGMVRLTALGRKVLPGAIKNE